MPGNIFFFEIRAGAYLGNRASVYAAWAAMDSALLALGSVSLKKNTITVGHWPQSEEGIEKD